MADGAGRRRSLARRRVLTIATSTLLVVPCVLFAQALTLAPLARAAGAIPTVSLISPTSGPKTGSTLVSITGTNFIGVTAVQFGTTAATGFTVNSATSMTAITPSGTSTVAIKVTNASGTSASVAADKFTYVADTPAVQAISPTSGPKTGGTLVSITGTNFIGVTAVKFGTTAATSFTVNSATSITATTPSGTSTVAIKVTNASGTSASVAADKFTYVTTAPTVQAISPTSGPKTGGTLVSITGTNFIGVTAVKFGTTTATSFTVNSATTITATTPSGTSTVAVEVTNASGTSASVAADKFSYVADTPAVQAISPTSGPKTGGTLVSVTGSNFIDVTAVKFGTKAASSFTVNSATSITATSPPGTSSVAIEVTNPSGTSASVVADKFTYVATTPKPVVVSISPTSGPPAGGTGVVINGSGFSGASAVDFGIVAASSFSVTTDSSIIATAPPGTATVDVTVTTPGGTSATSNADQFAYPPPLVITTQSLPLAWIGSSYSTQLASSGGIGSVTWTLASGQLPPGLALSNIGLLSGTPTSLGSYDLTVQASDSAQPPSTSSTSLTLTVTSSVLTDGQSMTAGESLTSPSNLYHADMQSDGNFVVYPAGDNASTGGAAWSTVTGGNTGDYVTLQTDGNLVVYPAGDSSSTGGALWNADTGGNPNDYLKMQDDGNLVVYSEGGVALWSSVTGKLPNTQYSLGTGEELNAGQSLWSPSNLYHADMQSDGNFVVYPAGDNASTGGATWSTVTGGNTGDYVTLQSDGNLVIYPAGDNSSTGGAIWNAGTAGNPNDFLKMQDDGNLVVYSEGGLALWSSVTGKIPESTSVLQAGDAMSAGQSLWSPSNLYHADMQTDGNFVVYPAGDNASTLGAIWDTQTGGNPGDYVALQPDGNLVIYPAGDNSSTGGALWNAGTEGNPGDYLAMQDDGNLVIYSSSGQALWSSMGGRATGSGGGSGFSGQSIVSAAASQSNVTSYCWAGGGPTGPSHGEGNGGGEADDCASQSTVGYDCAGLVIYAVYQASGGKVTLPRPSQTQGADYAQYGGTLVSQADLQPGDIVFLGGGSMSAATHEGVYAGGGMLWDADTAYSWPGGSYPNGVYERSLSNEEAGLSFDGAVQFWPN